MSDQPTPAGELEEVSAELAEALMRGAPSSIPMKITRTILPNPGWKYGLLKELAPDVHYTLTPGSPEPMAISLFTLDSTTAIVAVVSPEMKAGILKAMTGGVELANAADLAKEIAKT